MMYICNSIVVGLFGIILSASFCDIQWTKQNRFTLAGCVTLLFLCQGVVYICADGEMVRSLYPVIMHLPVVGLLGILSKKYIWSWVAVLTSYLCLGKITRA